MSTPINEGGPAFPCMVFSGDGNNDPEYSNGMTLRDWFACQETLSDCSNDISVEFWEAITGEKSPKWKDDRLGTILFECRARAKLRMMRADAMLAERAKGAAK